MTGPISNGGSKDGFSDVKTILSNVKLTPKDEHLLETPFGKMIAKTAPGEDRITLIKTVKKAFEQWVQSMMDEMKRQLKKQEESQKKLGRALKGDDYS